MASLPRFIKTLPMPLFGSVGTATAFLGAKARTLPRFAGWIAPLGAGALWFIWPAVDDSWKISVGIKADPAAAAAAPPKASDEQSALAKLPSSAIKKIEDAPKAHAGHGETDEDKLLAKAARTGDFTYLEEKWEEFAEKASRPGEEDEEEEEEGERWCRMRMLLSFVFLIFVSIFGNVLFRTNSQIYVFIVDVSHALKEEEEEGESEESEETEEEDDE